VGLSHNIPKGYIPGTDIGCMSVFGYDPQKYFTGRGPLEAAEHGIELKSGEIAFRCNLVTIEGEILKDFSADHISLAEAKALLEDLDALVQKKLKGRVRFYPGDGTGYRNLMICREGNGLEKVVCTPPHDIMGKKYKKYLPQEKNTHILTDLMKISEDLFKNHPVNHKRLGAGIIAVLSILLQAFWISRGCDFGGGFGKGNSVDRGLGCDQSPGSDGVF
jgi:2,3-bisphosphoglycerate-independent phosphoglycerate mutase